MEQLNKIQDKYNCYFSYLENKYWTSNSVLVPSTKPLLNESFKKLTDIYKDHADLFTEIYWDEHFILGEIKLPGDWNYCYINEKGFHLVKTKSDGSYQYRNKWTEFFYYQIIYDDWTNEFLTNSVDVRGSIVKTGDIDLVKNNIHRTSPITQNVNELYDINATLSKAENRWNLKNPTDKFFSDNSFSWLNPRTMLLINNFLKTNYEAKFNYDEETLTMPFMAQETQIGNWKNAIITSLIEFLNRGIAIYDINKQNFDYATFMGKYRALDSDDKKDEKVFVLTSTTGVKNVASTYVRGWWIKEVDLSGLTDIKELKPDLTDVDASEVRTWKNLSDKLAAKMVGGSEWLEWGKLILSYTQKEETVTMDVAYQNFFYTVINSLIVSHGGRLFTNISKQWTEWITQGIPRDKYGEFGFYENVKVEHRENYWHDWTYKNRSLTDYYFWWFNFYKPGDYMTGNRFQKNHVLYRGISAFSGSLFMGADRRPGNKITKKIDGKNLRQWKDELKRLSNPGEYDKANIEQNVDNWYSYLDKYEGRENFDFTNSETNHKVRGLIHLDRYKLTENIGGRVKEIDPKIGIMLVPDYENAAYVLAEYETSEITEGALKTEGKNKVLAFAEILDHINPQNNYDINNPSEDLLTGSEWEKVSHATRLGTLVKRMLLPPEDEDKQIKLRYKAWRKNGERWTYTERDEYAFKLRYIIPKIPGRWNWYLTVPTICEVDFMKILDKYRDLPNFNFVWINGSNKNNKGIKDVDKYYCQIFDQTQYNFVDSKEFQEIPEKIRRNTIFIFIDVHPRESATEEEKSRLRELLEELHTGFFRSPWTDGKIYQSSNIPGNVSRYVYKPKDGGEDVYYWGMTHFRPYKGVWYSSRLNIGQEFEPGYTQRSNFYESKKKNHLFTMAWNYNHSEACLFLEIGNYWHYTDRDYYTWKAALNNFFIAGQADRIDLTPNGIFTANAIDFQENHAYKWHWVNQREDLNTRVNRQNSLAESAIFMETIKNKSISYTDKNLENPKYFKPLNYHLNDVGKLQDFFDKQNQLIPDYVWKYINPSNPISPLHNIKDFKQLEGQNTAEKVINYLNTELRPKLEKAFINLHNNLLLQPVIFDLVGTNFLLVANYDSSKNWSFELIIKRNERVLVQEGRQKCTFTSNQNHGDDVAKAINSLMELNIYGHKFPLKERILLSHGNLKGIECEKEKIEDRFQSPSDWFYINITTNMDKIRTQIEVPKIDTLRANMSLHEKQRLFNTMIYNNAERYWETQKYYTDKEQFFRQIKREERFQYLDAAGEIFGFANNALALKGAFGGVPTVTSVFGGLFSFFGTLFNAGVGHVKRSQERADRLELGARTFDIQGKTLAVKHRSADEADRLAIQNMAINNRYPEFNNSLIFEELNKLINNTNIYLTIYTPGGDLMQMLKDHYNEYGYDIFLDNQSCTGINSIKKHLQFLTITQNNHPNATIRNMIEQRLLTGIKVIP